MQDIIPEVTEILLNCRLITILFHSCDFGVKAHDSRGGGAQVLHHNAQTRVITIDVIITLYH